MDDTGLYNEALNDLVDEWHESDSVQELYEYIGMTWEEYSDWVYDSNDIPDRIKDLIDQFS